MTPDVPTFVSINPAGSGPSPNEKVTGAWPRWRDRLLYTCPTTAFASDGGDMFTVGHEIWMV